MPDYRRYRVAVFFGEFSGTEKRFASVVCERQGFLSNPACEKCLSKVSAVLTLSRFITANYTQSVNEKPLS